MKILIAPNYYKGTISAVNAAEIIKNAIKEARNEISIEMCPLADGGDGTIEAIHTNKDGSLITIKVHDPLNRIIKAEWLKTNNNVAIIESAKANGLSLLKQEECNPFITTTYGVGELIHDAIKHNCKKIIIGLGGSATNDAAYGALKALGVKFYDKNINPLSNNINSFKDLHIIDTSGLNPNIKDIEIIMATDVTNPLTGQNGASYSYATQKGAKQEDLKALDKLLTIFANKCSDIFHKDCKNIPGAGAAGGLAYGFCEILNAKIVDGFNVVSEQISLEEKIMNSDIIITGEGKLDYQSLWGKAPIRIAELAKKHNKPCYIIAGSIENCTEFDSYFDMKCSLVDEYITLDQAKSSVKHILYSKTLQLIQTII